VISVSRQSVNDHAHSRRPGSEGRARKQRRYLIANVCFAVFLWLVLIGTTPLQEWVTQGPINEGDFLNQALYVGIFLMLMLGESLTRQELSCLPTGIALLLAYCVLSAVWAVAPFISLRRSLHCLIVVWICFRCVGDLGPARVLQVLRVAMAALLAINYLMVFATPFGVHGEVFGDTSSVVGSWRGILPHKNIAGAACALTVLLFVFDNTRWPRAATILVTVAATIFLFYTQSRTSGGMLAVAILLGSAISLYDARHRAALGIAVLMIVGLAAPLVFADIGAFSNIVDDPGSLTGRGAIWPLLIDYAGDHFWTGAGFGSFWMIGDDSPIWRLTSGWVAKYSAHGHNGFLDLMVTIGVPGLVLAVVTLIVQPSMRLLTSLSITKSHRALLFALLAFCTGQNLTESSLLNGAALVQVFMMITIAMVYRGTETEKRPHRRRWMGIGPVFHPVTRSSG
jgi:O-antigen ligase